jgi:very-short-patch-repair endonuclease
MATESEILGLLTSHPGLKGREIASRLNGDKAEVNSILWRLQGRGLTRQDNAYCWSVVQKGAGGTSQPSQAPGPPTALGRLCRYYLECLSLDDEAGLRPIPQYPEEKFLLDFALFADGRKLNIKVDGERYHRAWNGELLRRDQPRNLRLIELWWDVMRFWVYQLHDEMPACIQRVNDWTRKTTNNPQACH